VSDWPLLTRFGRWGIVLVGPLTVAVVLAARLPEWCLLLSIPSGLVVLIADDRLAARARRREKAQARGGTLRDRAG
jgi:hypothetical protein